MTDQHDLSKTAKALGSELDRRIDELQREGHIDVHAATVLGGIVEGLNSLEGAMNPAPKVAAKSKPSRTVLAWAPQPPTNRTLQDAERARSEAEDILIAPKDDDERQQATRDLKNAEEEIVRLEREDQMRLIENSE